MKQIMKNIHFNGHLTSGFAKSPEKQRKFTPNQQLISQNIV